MSLSLMNTKEVADYLNIHEKQVYALIKAGRLPATRVTGKWIFPKNMVDNWIEEQAKITLEDAKLKTGRIEGALLAAGSNDPALDILLTSMHLSHPEFIIFTATMGSIEGLKALGHGYTDVAWSHLFDPQTGSYNTAEALAPYLNHIKAVVVHLFNRDIGWLVPPGNPLGIEGFDDIATKKPKIVNRQPGAGTRVYLDYRLKMAGIAPELIPGYNDVVFTHMDAGLAVLTGNADTALASISMAKLLGLKAIPVTTESFDMVLEQTTFFTKGIQTFMNALQAKDFQDRVSNLGGYDFKNAGHVIHATV
ncbi:MAG: hypothetical protein CSYNP_03284 [Syntrophus sp. SKADARSKE-3]|nr:hypothetical protein [Syntrophus sp. SKADARSKE-3]